MSAAWFLDQGQCCTYRLMTETRKKKKKEKNRDSTQGCLLLLPQRLPHRACAAGRVYSSFFFFFSFFLSPPPFCDILGSTDNPYLNDICSGPDMTSDFPSLRRFRMMPISVSWMFEWPCPRSRLLQRIHCAVRCPYATDSYVPVFYSSIFARIVAHPVLPATCLGTQWRESMSI